MLIMSRHEGVSFHVMSIYQYKYVTKTKMLGTIVEHNVHI